MIDVRFGLLDTLVSLEVLTSDQVELILEKGTHTGEVRQLFDEITKKPIENEKRDIFFTALDQTQHKHVSNFIRGKGQRAAEYADDWPLIYCSTEVTIMDKNRSKFIDLIDPRNGLLDEMLAAGCITNRRKNSVERCSTDEQQNELIFHILRTKALATYNTFIQCLLRTKQHQVVSLLAPHLVGDVRPVSDEQQFRLQKNYATLVRIMISKGGLIAGLLASDCITWRHKEYIEAAETQSGSNKRLIEIIRRGSEADFEKFLDCLNQSGQRHVSRILTAEGAVAHIVATISSVNREERERWIVRQMAAYLRDTPDERREEMFGEVRQQIDELRDNEVTIVGAKIGNSIGLFFFCESLRGLHYLRDNYSNQNLALLLQEIFIALLRTEDAVTDLRVTALHWDLSDYMDCIQHICVAMKLPILSHVYQLAKQIKGAVYPIDDVRSFVVEDFPFELIEMILVRATGHLFVTINRRTPRAEVYTLATLSAVSLMWREALTHRRYIRRQFGRYFRYICRPFRCSPRLVTSIRVGDDNTVMGVAELNNKLYVTCERSNTVRVYCQPSFEQLEDLEIQGLQDPSNIAVCQKASQLYITDWSAQCAIWRVNVSAGFKQADKLISIQWRPRSLSVKSSRLLITPYDGELLFLYDQDGNQLQQIELPHYLRATHAVETTRNTFIVSHHKRYLEDTDPEHHGVTEVDVAGRAVGKFKNPYHDLGSVQFDAPRHVLLDNSNHVIVADCRNERIVLLRPDLQLKRILVDSLHGEPLRLCMTSSRTMFVSYYSSANIDVFDI